ncbi:MAG: YidB family protein [Pseudomonadota bacterium]
MGLLDVLNGMQNGPRGQTDPNAKGGMSPITMAILALLAYKGIKHLSGNGNPAPQPSGNPQRIPDAPTQTAGGGGLGSILGGLFGGGQSPSSSASTGGGLGDLLKGPLGGMLAGGAAGSVLSGGLNDLLKQFQQNGHGEVAKSWVGTGPNQEISASDLAKSIGAEDLDKLSQQTGLPLSDLLEGLRRELPGAVDELTPHGRLPTSDEASRWV